MSGTSGMTTIVVGAALVELVQVDAAGAAPAYLLTDAGLQTRPEPALNRQNEGGRR